MEQQREPYVRPLVMRLEYSTDTGVSMAQACKAEGDENAAGGSNCLDDNAIPPICREIGTS